MKSVLRQLPSFLGPGLLLFLLAIQIAAGFSGFQGSENGLLRLLEVPGVLLGWGGVALLLPLLLWMLLDWWGYTPSGFALKSLGAMSLGVASAAVAGLFAGHAGGGVVGSALAELLGETLGTPLAAALLVAMAAPAGVLAFSRLGVGQLRAVTAAPAAPAKPAPPTPSGSGRRPSLSSVLSGAGDLARRAVALIPRRPAAASDLEALARNSAARRGAKPAAAERPPVQFQGSRDVGEIRYADEPDPEPIEDDEEALPSIADVLTGKYEGELALESDPVYEDVARPDYETRGREDDGPAEEDGPIHVDAEGNIVRSAPIRPIRSDVVRSSRDESPDAEVTHIGESGPPASLRVRRDADEVQLPPGVRWADDPISHEPVSHAPVSDAPDSHAPVGHAPVGHAPVGHAPVGHAPVGHAPVGHEPEPAVQDPPQDPGSGAPDPGTVSPQPTIDRPTSDDDVGVPRDLPRAEPLVLDALRGTTAQRAAKRQAARRPGEARAEERNVVRTALKDSLTSLAQTGTRASHLKKLEATGLFDLEPKAKQQQAQSRQAVTAEGDTPTELEPKSAEPSALSPSAKAEAARRAAQKALVHQLRGEDRDAQFADAVEIALQRGAVSLVLLSRRLRTSYARSRALLDRLVETDVVSRANEHGSHQTLLTAAFWAEVQALAE